MSTETPLTHFEKAFIKLISEGMTNKDMSRITKYKPVSLEQYRYKLYKKIGARNAAHCVSIAYEMGILKTGNIYPASSRKYEAV